jgi:hypothetical protein
MTVSSIIPTFEPELSTEPADDRSPRGQEAHRGHKGRLAARLVPVDLRTSRLSRMA